MTLILYQNSQRVGQVDCRRSDMTKTAKQLLSYKEEIVAIDNNEMVAQYKNIDGVPCKAVMKYDDLQYVKI